MSIDVDRLRSNASFRDRSLGIEERFVELSLGTGRSLGVLSLPLGDRSQTGWVLCHSFGPEQANLNAVEVTVARELAAGGSPVLRFQCQGYGDSEHSDFLPTVDTHVRDTVDAVRLLGELVDVASIGLIGIRFGSASALLASAEGGVDHLALVSPTVQGRRYVRDLVRARTIIELTGTSTRPDDEDPWSALQNGGSIRVRGALITPEVFRGFDGLDLRTVAGFDGSALLVQVSAGTGARRDVTELADALTAAGATVTVETVVDGAATTFGERSFRQNPEDRGGALANVSAELDRKLAGTVSSWCLRRTDRDDLQEGARIR